MSTILRYLPTASQHPMRLRWVPVLPALLLAFTLSLSEARADVIGDGDITPSIPGEDFFGNEIELPDLPADGGDIEGDIIVGGTGVKVMETDFGFMSVSGLSPAQPLLSENGIIGDIYEPDDNIFGAGRVTVNGFGTRWEIEDTLVVGNFGQGYLELSGGGKVFVNHEDDDDSTVDLIIAAEEFSQGEVTLTGFGSQLITPDMIIGGQGNATMQLLARSRVDIIGDVTVGEDRPATQFGGVGYVLVDGRGTQWNVGNDLFLGDEGDGSLVVRNEGLVNVQGDVTMGGAAVSYSSALVTGANSRWQIDDSLNVGSAAGAEAELQLTDSGLVTVNGPATVHPTAQVIMSINEQGCAYKQCLPEFEVDTLNNEGIIRGEGRVDVETLTNLDTGEIRNAAKQANVREYLLVNGAVQNDGVIESLGGEMEFAGPVVNEDLIVGRDAIFRFQQNLDNANGRLSLGGDTTVHGDINGGDISIFPDGTVLFVGTVALDGASLMSFQVGDNQLPTQITGDLDLGGTLEITLDNGYEPQIGDSFELLSADAVNGTFDSALMPITPGIDWDVEYTADQVLLNSSILAFLHGDFNQDGAVDGLDLGLWRTGFGIAMGATAMDGDADGDGDVDGRDFLIWQSQVGLTLPVSGLANVPEPATAVLMLVGTLMTLRRNRAWS